MKKVYVKPEIEVVEVEYQPMMADSISTNLPDVGFGGEGDEDPDANRHRGEWGDLWAN